MVQHRRTLEIYKYSGYLLNMCGASCPSPCCVCDEWLGNLLVRLVVFTMAGISSSYACAGFGAFS